VTSWLKFARVESSKRHRGTSVHQRAAPSPHQRAHHRAAPVAGSFRPAGCGRSTPSRLRLLSKRDMILSMLRKDKRTFNANPEIHHDTVTSDTPEHSRKLSGPLLAVDEVVSWLVPSGLLRSPGALPAHSHGRANQQRSCVRLPPRSIEFHSALQKQTYGGHRCLLQQAEYRRRER